MKKNRERHELLTELLAARRLSSHDEILAHLACAGMQITQATLSRDLKTLGAFKKLDAEGRYYYTIPRPDGSDTLSPPGMAPAQLRPVSQEVLKVARSGNMLVIKTRNGCAAGLAYDIDCQQIPEIIGTLSATDTVLAVIAQDADEERLATILEELLGA